MYETTRKIGPTFICTSVKLHVPLLVGNWKTPRKKEGWKFGKTLIRWLANVIQNQTNDFKYQNKKEKKRQEIDQHADVGTYSAKLPI